MVLPGRMALGRPAQQKEGKMHTYKVIGRWAIWLCMDIKGWALPVEVDFHAGFNLSILCFYILVSRQDVALVLIR